MGWLSSAWDSVCSFTSGVCSVAKDVFVGVASVAKYFSRVHAVVAYFFTFQPLFTVFCQRK